MNWQLQKTGNKKNGLYLEAQQWPMAELSGQGAWEENCELVWASRRTDGITGVDIKCEF